MKGTESKLVPKVVPMESGEKNDSVELTAMKYEEHTKSAEKPLEEVLEEK